MECRKPFRCLNECGVAGTRSTEIVSSALKDSKRQRGLKALGEDDLPLSDAPTLGER